MADDRGRLRDPLSGFNQPLILLVIAACLERHGVSSSIDLRSTQSRGLPEAIRVRGVRLVMLYAATLFYGFSPAG